MSRNKIILAILLDMRGNKKLWGGLVLLLALGTALGLLGLIGPVAPESPLPNPNGYDLIRQATTMMRRQSWWNVNLAERDELALFVQEGHPVLQLARQGLALPAQRPLPNDLMDYHSGFRGYHWAACLAKRFVAESMFCSQPNDTKGAVLALQDLAKLGGVMARGGLKGDLHEALVTLKEAAKLLIELSPRLRAGECSHPTDLGGRRFPSEPDMVRLWHAARW